MRLLFVTAALPYPPASGGAIRTLGLIDGLYRAGHSITLLSFHHGENDPQDTPLAQLCERIVTLPPPQRRVQDRLRTLLFSRKPDIAHRFYSEDFAAALRDLLAETAFDLIQFEAIEAVAYLPLARALQPEARLSFDTFNAEYALQRSMFAIDRATPGRWAAALYSWIQVQRITRYERAMCRMADLVFAVSQEDADLLRGFRDDRIIHVVPSGIFVDDYTTPPALPGLAKPALVFTGTMAYRPNVDAMLWFTEAVLPHIRQEQPNVQLYIVGSRPHARLDVLRDQAGIHITGWVEATQPYLHEADVYIAPLRMGSGTRLKLLEAMASGCAIVATTTAAAGLHEDVKAGMIVVDEPQAMAQAIRELLQDRTRRQELGNRARDLVRRYYDWPVIVPRLIAAYRDIGLG